jgi:hypothetical protein
VLHGPGQRLVAEPMGVTEGRQCRHSALVLSPRDLEAMPDDIGDRAEWNDDDPNGNIVVAGT